MQDIHLLVQHPDDVDRIPGDQIKHHMPTMVKTEISFTDVLPVLSGMRIFGQPDKALFQTF